MACEVFLRLYTQYMLAHACLRLWPINCQLICRTCKKWATAGSDRVRSIPAWSYTRNLVSRIRAEDNDPIPINVKSVTLRIQRLTRWWGAAPPRGNWRLGSVPVGLRTHTYSTCISVKFLHFSLSQTKDNIRVQQFQLFILRILIFYLARIFNKVNVYIAITCIDWFFDNTDSLLSVILTSNSSILVVDKDVFIRCF